MLAGKQLLVVDDEPLLAFDVGEILEAQGAEVIGPCTSLAEARFNLAQLPAPPDGAVLDIQVGEELIWPLAEELERNGTKCVFVSAYFGPEERNGLDRSRPRLTKPLNEGELRKALKSILKP